MKSRLKETMKVLNERLAPWLNWKMGFTSRNSMKAGLLPARIKITKNQPPLNR